MSGPNLEWDPQNKEDCKHIIRQALARTPEAGELIMLTIRLHLERPETIPRITDAAQRLQRTAEYRYCTAAWDERADTRPAAAARSRGPEAAPRRSVALPEEAEQTAAEQAIRALLAGFPGEFSVFGHNVGNEMVPEILQTLDEVQVLALRSVCEDGRALADQVRDYTENSSHTIISTGQAFDTEGYLKDALPDLDAEERAQAQLHRAISFLACDAHYEQAGWPVLKKDDLEWWDVGSTALGAVEAAVRMLGPEAEATTVRREATRLMINNLDSMTDDEREGKDPYEIGLAIERLVNVRDYPNGINERVKMGLDPVIHLGVA